MLSYLSEFLLQKGYEVHGLIRRCSTVNTERLESVSDSMFFRGQLFSPSGLSWSLPPPPCASFGRIIGISLRVLCLQGSTYISAISRTRFHFSPLSPASAPTRCITLPPRYSVHVGTQQGSGCFTVNTKARTGKVKSRSLFCQLFALQSHVKVSFEMPEHTSDSTAIGVLRLLEAIRAAGLAHETRM